MARSSRSHHCGRNWAPLPKSEPAVLGGRGDEREEEHAATHKNQPQTLAGHRPYRMNVQEQGMLFWVRVQTKHSFGEHRVRIVEVRV